MRGYLMGFSRGAAMVALVVGLGAACGSSKGLPQGSSSSGVDPAEDTERAAKAYATRWCAAVAKCLPGAFAGDYQDPATCIARVTVWVLRARFAEGSNTTAADLDACTTSVDYDTCNGWNAVNERTLPPTCLVPGSLAAGEPCAYDRQCSTLYCYQPAKTYPCGTCAARASTGEPCTQASGCFGGAGCSAGVCTPYVDRGGTCGPGVGLCQFDDGCIAGHCAARLPKDAPCDPTADQCQSYPTPLVCSGSPPRCEPGVVHALGESCGILMDGTVQVCAYGLKCSATVSTTIGVCAPVEKDGDGCFGGWIFETGCEAPALCFQKRCEILDATSCRAASYPP